MKAVNVSSPSDVSQNALNKLTKGPLITFFLSMLKMYEKNVSMCKSAAAKLDHMKNEKINLQKQLIDFQSEQMNSVKKTVETEMKTWAEVAKKNITQSKVVTTKTVKEAVRAANEEEERSKNLIVYGVSESEDSDWNEIYNNKLNEVVKSIHETTVTDGSLPTALNVYRLGKKEPNKTRPIKAEFGSSIDVDTILKNAHKLKANSDFKSVYLSPNRTKEQRAAHSKLVEHI